MLRDVIASILRDIGAGRIPKDEGLRICRQLKDAASAEAENAPAGEDIAIIGVAGRYPHAANLDEFWENLKAGRDCVSEVPRERWRHERYGSSDLLNGKQNKWGGFIDDVDSFDAPFFNISPREAESIDPQERVFLEVAWATLEDADYTRRALQAVGPDDMPGNVGVFVGVTYQEYQLFGAELQARGKNRALPGISAGVANRVSYFCNFHGPSMAVDTMCSSSLTAVHLACQSLATGQCELALAGGVNLSLHPNKYLLLAQGNFVSSKGHCASFGAEGDGYVPGEGAGCVLLKPLSRALRDGDRIYGVIRSTAVNHGGKTNGYTVPNPNAQAAVIRRALTRSSIDPRDVSYVEAHGTGTLLGDPIEITSLSKAYEAVSASTHCAIGSVKSNIGHCEAAAGIAGLTKVLLQMKHGQLVPSLHADELNPNIDFAATPFRVQRELSDWEPANGTRIAGISSFGAGGSNAHVIVEEWRERADGARLAPHPDAPVLIVLSAQNEDRLRDAATNLLGHVAGDLVNIAYTLQVGREAMECRVAFLVRTADELIARIEDWLAGAAWRETTFTGRGSRDHPTRNASQASSAVSQQLENSLNQRRLAELARLWVNGTSIDWRRIHPEPKPRLVGLPSYPFDKSQRYWFDSYEKKRQPAAMPLAATAGPVSSRAASISIPVSLSIVSCKLIEDCIAVVRMEDRRHRNQLASTMVEELQSIFSAIANDPRVKVVVLTGYDDVFCMGGTKETLVGVADGRLRYADVPFVYRGLVDCPVPVIAAMEGHAVGGGLALGCQADIVYLAEESVYCANFMQYGFTPGMGGTLFFIEKFGTNLAHEMMFTADSISGKALKDKGAPLAIKPRSEVLPEAMLKARSLAAKPIDALKLLKSTLSKRTLESLPRVVEEELAMHEETITRPEVRQIIEHRIDRMEALSETATPPVADDAAKDAIDAVESGIDVPSIEAQLHGIIARLLHMEPQHVHAESTFQDMGVDSIVAVELARDVNAAFGLTLDAVVLYDCPTVRKYALHIAGQLETLNASLASIRSDRVTQSVAEPQAVPERQRRSGKLSLSELSPPGSAVPSTPPASASTDPRKIGPSAPDSLSLPRAAVSATVGLASPPPAEALAAREESAGIAVIGMAGQFPGAKNLDAFWHNLTTGTCSVEEVPATRWSLDEVYDPDPLRANKTYSRVGGFLDAVDRFDPLFFNLSPAEAEQMDPQQRLFLQTAWHAFEDAGYAAEQLAGASCGVFVGVGQGDYLDVLKASGRTPSAQSLMGNTCSMLAARIAYVLDLKGPNMAIDTACSSSLVAIHQGCRSILSGESELALAGGVYVMTTPMMHIMTCRGAMLSPTGQCRAFDQGADGFVLGEGVGALVLKDLNKAVRDGDHIYGVIRGSGVNYDGATNGITAPSAISQEALETEVYEKFGIDPAAIGMVEAHGTGTKLGDPIELKALTKAFRNKTDEVGYCAIGSVKSNIGHALAAAGVAGAIKTLMCLHRRKLVPTVHYTRTNEHIDLGSSPFYVSAAYRDWEPNAGHAVRQAALSSFGLSGTNAHAVFEEYVAASPAIDAERSDDCHLLTLSAKTEDGLRQRIEDLADWLVHNATGARLSDIAFTLNRGRSHFAYRCALVARSIDEAAAVLRSAAHGSQANVLSGQAGSVAPTDGAIFRVTLQQIAESLQRQDRSRSRSRSVTRDEMLALAGLYVKGFDLPWDALHDPRRSRRVSLPGYPFAQERCWASPVQRDLATPDERRLHALIGSNTSDLFQQQYATSFTGNEFYLNDHRVHGTRILPGAAILEMARAAAGLAAKQRVFKIRDVAWARPISVQDKPQTVVMRLQSDQGAVTFNLAYEGEVSEEYCAKGVVEFGRPVSADTTTLDLSAISARCPNEKGSADCYQLFKALGIAYGPSFRTIRTLRFSEGEALADLRMPQLPGVSGDDFWLNPALLDGALQAGLGIVLGNGESVSEPAVPYALRELVIHDRIPDEAFAHVTRTDGAWNIAIADKSGRVLVELKELRSRSIASQDRGLLALTSCWVDEALPPAPSMGSSTLVFTASGERLASVLASTRPDTDLLALPSADEGTEAAFLALFEHVKRRLQTPLSRPHQYVLLASPGDDPCRFAALTGLIKTASLENPGIRGKVIHWAVNEQAISAEIDALAGSVAEVRWNAASHRREVKAFQDAELPLDKAPSPFREGGVYWITGGVGGLGLLTARHIAKTANAKIVLSGRSELNDRQRVVLRELEETGAEVLYVRCHVSRLGDVEAALDAIRAKFGALNGIIHGAGVIRDAFILKKEAEQVRDVLAPKIAGVMNLLRATSGDRLDFLVLYSAAAGSLGNLGQCDYAGANAFMDAIALEHRYRRIISLGWPLWADGGMTVDAQTEQMMRAAKGVEPMPTAAGLKLLDAACAAGHPHLLVLYGMRDKLRRTLVDASTPVFAQDTSAQFAGSQVASGPSGDISEADVIAYINKQLSIPLKLSPDRIEPDRSFEEYGVDSVMVLEVTGQFERDWGPLPKTLFFEHANVRALSRHFMSAYPLKLNSILAGNGPSNRDNKESPFAERASAPRPFRQPLPEPVAATARRGLDIAIVGLAGRYPKAENLEAFWNNLKAGVDCISEIPADRWDHGSYYDPDKSGDGKVRSKWGGFLNDVDKFDPSFFKISRLEAGVMDPQERLFLEVAWEALEDAGYMRNMQMRQSVGVYVGLMYSEYQLYGAGEQAQGRPIALSGSPASVANRVSYQLNLRGPSMTVDSMCSSSFTAIHLACQSLRGGQCDMALAGGVNLSIHPNKYLLLGQGQFVSSKGRCESFGVGGDGYVPGEGVGCALLKTLEAAQADGDHIYGVIRGVALNHGGKSNGYTVPNPAAQQEVIEAALNDAGVSPRDISYIEAHGTGTSLGDPVEIEGLSRAFRTGGAETGFCAIGSVKSNIGHCESAAGMAGLTKVLLQMKHRQLVPSLHAQTLNPHIDFKATPFVVQQELAEWRRPVVEGSVVREVPRIAGISSFGAGGSNAHVIVEEWPIVETRVTTVDGPAVIVLSARTDEQLRRAAENLRDHLAGMAQTGSSSLLSVAYTLQTGREAMDRRLAFVASSVKEAVSLLATWIDCRAIARSQNELLQAVADDWMAGRLPEWSRLYPHGAPSRVSLPTYPFARERCWFPRVAQQQQKQQQQKNKQHVFERALSGRESWLSAHQVHGAAVLPAVGFLDLVLQAGREAAPSRHLTLSDVVWLQPFVAGEDRTLWLVLDPDTQGFVFEARSDASIHCRGSIIVANAAPAEERIDIDRLKASRPVTVSDGAQDSFYQAFAQAGIDYGLSYRNIRALWATDSQCVAWVEQRETHDGEGGNQGGHILYPPLADSALQAIAGIPQKMDGATKLPFSLGQFDLRGRLPSAFYVHVTRTSDLRYDIALLRTDGVVIGRLSNLELRAAGDLLAGLTWSVQWQPEALQAGQSKESQPGKTLVIGGEHGFDLEKSIRVFEDDNRVVLDSGAGEPPTPPEVSKVYFLGGLDDRMFDALDPSRLDERYRSGTLRYFRHVKSLLETHRDLDIVVLTQQTQAVSDADAVDAGSAGLIGLCQSLAKECPGWSVTVVDVDRATLADKSGHHDLLSRLSREPKQAGFGCVAYRGTERYVARVAPLALPNRGLKSAIREGGTYVIAGGAGGIGYTISEALVKQYGTRVVWLGRRPLDEEIGRKIASLKGHGPDPLYIQVDMTDHGQMAEALDGLKRDGSRIHGVIHSALVLNDQALRNMSEEQFESTARTKVRGSIVLAETFGRAALDWICFFSSAQSFMGGPGQANYAAGSSFEDAYARALRAHLDCSVHVINWGFWGEVGAVARDDYRDRMARLGIGSVNRQQGVQAFLRVLSGGVGQVLVLKAAPGLMAQLGGEPEKPVAAPAVPDRDPAKAASTGAIEFISRLVADTLKIPAGEIGADTPFEVLGVDSIIAAVLADRLEKVFGRLPRTLVFEHQTVEQLKNYFSEHHDARLREVTGGVAETREAAPQPTPDYPPELIAIHPDGTKPASFWVHGLVGFAHVYRNVSQVLGSDFPVYGLQARGIDGQHPPHGSVEEMAAHYVACIRQVRPRGPYYLGGYSSGGVIALEMARQLAAAGETIGCVFLLDTYPMTARVIRAMEEKMNYAMRSVMTANLFLTGMGNDAVRLRADQLDGVTPDQHVLHLLKLIEASGESRIPSSQIYRMLRGSIDVQNSTGAALTAYNPLPYDDSEVVFFRATGKFVDEGNALALPVMELDVGDREESWRDWIKSRLEVVNVASDHFGLLEQPFIGPLCRRIAEELDGPNVNAPAIVSQGRGNAEALVVGGGFAGLLTARVLARHFNAVTVLERDALIDNATERKGIPQGNHLHNLLKGGLNVLCDLFPGFERDLIEMGAVPFRIGYDLRQEDEFGLWPQRDFGLKQYCQSRALLERCIRRRLRDVPNVRIEDEVATKDLLWSENGLRVLGIGVVDRDGRDSERRADLIVNATGRRQTMLRDIGGRGWPMPEEMRIPVELGYSTCLFETPKDASRTWKGVYSHGSATEGQMSRYGGSVLPIENNRWIVTLGGRQGDFPPTDMEGFLDFARKLPTDTIYSAIRHARPVTGKIDHFRFPASVLRHFDRLEAVPERLLHVGDVICGFNPVLGQGMTSAALQIKALDALLAARGAQPDPFNGLELEFFHKAAQVVHTPWQLAAKSSIEDVETRASDQDNEYTRFRRIAGRAKSDANLHKALIETFHLIRTYDEMNVPPDARRKPGIESNGKGLRN